MAKILLSNRNETNSTSPNVNSILIEEYPATKNIKEGTPPTLLVSDQLNIIHLFLSDFTI